MEANFSQRRCKIFNKNARIDRNISSWYLTEDKDANLEPILSALHNRNRKADKVRSSKAFGQ